MRCRSKRRCGLANQGSNTVTELEQQDITKRIAESARRREGASVSRTSLRDRFNGWLQHHRLSAADSLARVLDNPGSSLLTWLVIGIALALPVGLNVALDNVSQVSAGWDSPAQISLFLQDDVAADRAKAARGRAGARARTSAKRALSPAKRRWRSFAPCRALRMYWPACRRIPCRT